MYRSGLKLPIRACKFKFASQLVSSGRAVFINDRSILLIEKEDVAKSSGLLKCGQANTYKSAAIDTNRQIFQGGLNRTEHQPKKLSYYSGAKVGHQ